MRLPGNRNPIRFTPSDRYFRIEALASPFSGAHNNSDWKQTKRPWRRVEGDEPIAYFLHHYFNRQRHRTPAKLFHDSLSRVAYHAPCSHAPKLAWRSPSLTSLAQIPAFSITVGSDLNHEFLSSYADEVCWWSLRRCQQLPFRNNIHRIFNTL